MNLCIKYPITTLILFVNGKTKKMFVNANVKKKKNKEISELCILNKMFRIVQGVLSTIQS